MKSKLVIAGLVIALLFLYDASALSLLPETKEDRTVIGVTIDDYYYTVVLVDGRITEAKYNGLEKTTYQVKTTSGQVVGFLQIYPTLSKIERVNYILDNFGLPLDLMMKIAGGYMKNG